MSVNMNWKFEMVCTDGVICVLPQIAGSFSIEDENLQSWFQKNQLINCKSNSIFIHCVAISTENWVKKELMHPQGLCETYISIQSNVHWMEYKPLLHFKCMNNN